VGDDDQSIYRFRGAKPEIMLNFEKDYTNASRVLLDKNYRSTRNIVMAAMRVVGNNKNRFDKEIHAVKEDGVRVGIEPYKDVAVQNETVIKKVIAYHDGGIPYNDMAVLFRTNNQPRALLEKMMEYNIPFRMKDFIQNLYDHWIAKDVMSYIRIAIGSMDRDLFLNIINRPKRYISRECLRETKVSLTAVKEYYKDKPYVAERIDKLSYDLAMLKNMNPYAAITYIRRAIGYDGYLAEYARFRRMNEDELTDVLAELSESSRIHDTYEEWFQYIEDYKQELARQAEKQKQKDADAVSMATYHASKGLEYRIVILTDVNEEITPHRKAVIEEDLEEERRMFYVAMTRAKDELHIYNVKERYGKEMRPSRFIGEIMLDRAELVKGAKVRHKAFGEGTVVECNKDVITIRFNNKMLVKKLSYAYCMQSQLLEIIPTK